MSIKKLVSTIVILFVLLSICLSAAVAQARKRPAARRSFPIVRPTPKPPARRGQQRAEPYYTVPNLRRKR